MDSRNFGERRMVEFNLEPPISLEDIPKSEYLKQGLYSLPEVEREYQDTDLDRLRRKAYPKLLQKLLAPLNNQKEKWRCHVKDWRRCFYWRWKYYYYGSLLYELKRVHKKGQTPNLWLVKFFADLSKQLPRWKNWTPKEILSDIHSTGKRIPKWNQGPRASVLLYLFQEEPFYQMLLTMIALEEGKAPRTIYEGIKRANLWLKSHKV